MLRNLLTTQNLSNHSSARRGGSPESQLLSVAEGGVQLSTNPFKTKNKHFYNMHRPLLEASRNGSDASARKRLSRDLSASDLRYIDQYRPLQTEQAVKKFL